MTRIHAIRTGLVQVRRPQMESRGSGPARLAHMLFDEEWSDVAPHLRLGHRARRGDHRRGYGRNHARPRARISPALASVLPARRTLLGASRRGARPAAARIAASALATSGRSCSRTSTPTMRAGWLT